MEIHDEVFTNVDVKVDEKLAVNVPEIVSIGDPIIDVSTTVDVDELLINDVVVIPIEEVEIPKSVNAVDEKVNMVGTVLVLHARGDVTVRGGQNLFPPSVTASGGSSIHIAADFWTR